MKLISFLFGVLLPTTCFFQSTQTVSSPDKILQVDVLLEDSIPTYLVTYDGVMMLGKSPLGLVTNE